MISYFLLKIDSMIETLTICNSANGFTFSFESAGEIEVHSGDYILGYIDEPINEVRYLFEIISADKNKIELKKKLELSEGISYDFSELNKLVPNFSDKSFSNISESTFMSILSDLSKMFCHSILSGLSLVSGQIPTTQKIYYGCPGTGKSYKVKGLTEGKDGKNTIYFGPDGKKIEDINAIKDKSKVTSNIFRTTFHPDYDYSSFVGSYKPVMRPIVDENGDSTKEELAYDFVPQVFTNAYVAAIRHSDCPVYLIIEEINRGNCAQIFGDLFQLLDRKDGVSEYKIKPDAELAKYLSAEGIPSDSLALPSNLHILATMNTSDQSLFPMDSAFKRRWLMEYVPIDLGCKDADFTFQVKDVEYKWLDFLGKVNPLIRKATDSEDKQMGEFFIKGNLTQDDFINKVMFYIWNDICKDLYSASRTSPLFFMRDHDGEEKKYVFTFAELFGQGRYSEEEKTLTSPDDLLEGFITKKLGLKPANEQKPATAEDAPQTAPTQENDE